jgi:hypothetical protein
VQDIHAWLRALTGQIPVKYVAEPQLPAKASIQTPNGRGRRFRTP